MALLHLDALPPRTTKGTVVRLLVQLGQIDRAKIGAIELRGRGATVEVPSAWANRLVKAIDGSSLSNRLIRAWLDDTGGASSDEDHFQRLLRLLDMEAEAEAQQALRQRERLTPRQAEENGHTLIDLAIQDQQPGLGGRCLVSLVKRNRAPLPWTRLAIGSPVLLSQQDGQQQWRGVVSDRDGRRLQIALAQAAEPEDAASLRLDLAGDEVARTRQRAALQRARSARGDRLAVLVRVLLGDQPPAFRSPAALDPPLPALNQPQCEAVRFALAAEDFAIVHGPPGTGKTTTVVELIRQAVRRGQKVLACAPSNLAVDNMFERLLAAGEQAVRLGHPARVLPELRDQTLDLIVDRHDDVRLARKLVRQAEALREKASKYTRAKPAPGARREMRDEAKRLIDDARRIEVQVVAQVLDRATVLCATLTGLDSEILGQRSFDLAVIDEACQSTEPACWIPLLRCQRLVLAGDHCQLPPTVVSRPAEKEGFGVSLLERLIERHGGAVSRQLTTQYRMHREIMDFSSREFYHGSLIADERVVDHLLGDLPGVAADKLTTAAVRFIDTAGAGYDEQPEPDGESRLNPGEAELVAAQIERLIEAGVDPAAIAVISPYAAQVRTLRGMIRHEGLEIDTVDGFQGREKEAVVISLVRSNEAGEIGFLADVRRMNVALTRARRKLLVIGDSATIAGHPFYQRLIDYFESLGAYHTVWEE